ncbi:hypothetical protein CF647_31980 [Burkholderia sp. 117]|nr:hypothetical protein CF649_25890 [Burkholderia sp. 136(2017)]PNX25118.1 hypothetical protein CF647_31980 [Burkholderia sp. 117]PNX35162.1 hypothetical protein CF648_25895 [Burkholderia sp. 137]
MTASLRVRAACSGGRRRAVRRARAHARRAARGAGDRSILTLRARALPGRALLGSRRVRLLFRQTGDFRRRADRRLARARVA